MTVTDPATYTEPLVRRGWMSFEPDQTILGCARISRTRLVRELWAVARQFRGLVVTLKDERSAKPFQATLLLEARP